MRHPDVIQIRQVLHGPEARTFLNDIQSSQVALSQLQTALEETENAITHKRAVLARYARMVKQRHDRDVREATQQVVDDLKKREQRAVRKLKTKATVTEAAAYQSALAFVKKDMGDIVTRALTRLVGHIPPTERAAAALETAIAEIAGKRRVVIRVHPGTSARVTRVLERRIGPQWSDALSIDRDPALDPDALEVQALDGSMTLTPATQIAILADALAEAHDG